MEADYQTLENLRYPRAIVLYKVITAVDENVGAYFSDKKAV